MATTTQDRMESLNECFGETSFKHLVAKAAQIRLAEQCNQLSEILAAYDIKRLMMRLITLGAMQSLNIQRNALKSSKYYKKIDFSVNIYEWSLKRFQERMKPNVKYVNVLHLEHPESLAIFKMLTDLENVENMIDLIYNDPINAVLKLKNCEKLLVIQTEVESQHKTNTTVLEKLRLQYYSSNKTEALKQLAMDHIYETINNRINDSIVIDPMERRYEINTHLAYHECIEHNCFLQLKELDDEVAYYSTKTHKMELASDFTHDFYYSEIQIMKTNIDFWSEKYENDYQHAENEGAIIKKKIDVMHADIYKARSRIEFFKEACKRRIILEQDRIQKAEEKKTREAELKLLRAQNKKIRKTRAK